MEADSTTTSAGDYLFKWAGSVLLIIAVVFGSKFLNKNSDSKDVQKQMYVRYMTLLNAEEFKEALQQLGGEKYIKSLVDKFHEPCFNDTYAVGGRRKSAQFDANRYIALMDTKIVQQIQTDTGIQMGEEEYYDE